VSEVTRSRSVWSWRALGCCCAHLRLVEDRYFVEARLPE